MKTFDNFISETDKSGSLLYQIYTNNELKSTVSDILKGKDYRVETKENSLEIYPKSDDTIPKFKDMLYSLITKAFTDGQQDIIKFVGSSKIDDLIDSDLKLDVEAVYK